MKNDRLISLNAALNLIDANNGILYDNPTLVSSLHNLIESLPSEQQWIPCSEQMPEKGEDVIIWLKEKDILGKNMRIAHLGYHSMEDKNFKYLGEVLVWYCNIYYCSLNDVIAWMPRPEDYKGDSND